jgi:mannose-6-phosphate isomerase-like protein (cupin superfamily)
MHVVNFEDIAPLGLPGLTHRTVAGPAQGLRECEVWVQTIEAGAATPVHRHDCEEVITILSGEGACETGGKVHAFGPNSALVIPPNEIHQITNTGRQDIRLVAVLTMTPVRVETPEGERINLPWDQDLSRSSISP